MGLFFLTTALAVQKSVKESAFIASLSERQREGFIMAVFSGTLCFQFGVPSIMTYYGLSDTYVYPCYSENHKTWEICFEEAQSDPELVLVFVTTILFLSWMIGFISAP